MFKQVFQPVAPSVLTHHFAGLTQGEPLAKDAVRTGNDWEDREADIVFVGGGPCGFIAAILTMEKDPAKKIFFREKQNYSREQNLKVDLSAFDRVPTTSAIWPLLEQHRRQGKGSFYIGIKDLQEKLEEIAKTLGVRIRKGAEWAVNEPEQLVEEYPSAKCYVGSDGARSVVRRNIFGDEFHHLKKLGFQAHVNYEVDGVAKQILADASRGAFRFTDSGKSAISAIRSMNFTLLEERVKGTAVRLIFDLPEEVFEEMEGATQRTPFHLNQIPQRLQKDINLWRGVKTRDHGEVSQSDSVTITAIKIEFKLSHKVYKVLDADPSKHFFLLGDAAASFPHRLGFNCGAEGAVVLSDALSHKSSYKNYSQFVRDLAVSVSDKAEASQNRVTTWKGAIWLTPMWIAEQEAEALRQQVQ